MKPAKIEKFTKQKKKELRMQIDKIKESARQRNYERNDHKTIRVPMEKCFYEARYCGR